MLLGKILFLWGKFIRIKIGKNNERAYVNMEKENFGYTNLLVPPLKSQSKQGR